MVERLFLAVSWGCLRFVIVVFPDHTHLLCLCLVLVLFCSSIQCPFFFSNHLAKEEKAGCFTFIALLLFYIEVF